MALEKITKIRGFKTTPGKGNDALVDGKIANLRHDICAQNST